jgi:hypothetical protein
MSVDSHGVKELLGYAARVRPSGTIGQVRARTSFVTR